MSMPIKIPDAGESITQVTIAKIFKNTGDHVEADAEILEVETDKVNQVVYAPGAGILELNVTVDQVVDVGADIGVVKPSSGGAPPPPKKQQEAVEKVSSQGEGLGVLAQQGGTGTTRDSTAPKGETPPARISVEESLRNTSKITQENSVAATPSVVISTESNKSVSVQTERVSRKKMSGLRKTIAARLVEAKNTTAMLTTFNEADMSAIQKLRKQEQDKFIKKHGIKLGFMSFFIKAVVSALKAYPEVNAYIDGNEIVTRHTYDIGVAVSTERGLMVPVLRDCDQLGFAGLEKSLGDFAKKARDGKIALSDLQGGGFTITNGGVFGSLLSTPIINPPQSAILGMHSIVERPMAVQGNVVIRPMMYLAVSYDHRIIDGKEAVQFLVHIKDHLEDPTRMLLDF